MTKSENLKEAIALHQAGRLPEAENIYQRILQADPNQPVALHLLGVIALQVGKYDIAVDLITKAIAIQPDSAEAYNNLGLALRELGKLDEAVACFHKALAVQPDFAEAHCNLLAQRIKPGTVIVFDEYIGNENWREDEFKAFQEAVRKYGWKYEYLCFSFMTQQVVVRIKLAL